MEYPCYQGSLSPSDGEDFGDMQCPCGDATRAEAADYQEVKFWLEAVAVPVVGAIGLICNVAAIPILLSRLASYCDIGTVQGDTGGRIRWLG